MKKEFTPEDLAHIKATYQNYGANLRWMLGSVALGVAGGLAAAFFLGGVSITNPALWVGFVYAAAVPAGDMSKSSTSVREFIKAPVSLVKEFSRRVKAIADGRRDLKERFADYY
jgi:hypothetical protein